MVDNLYVFEVPRGETTLARDLEYGEFGYVPNCGEAVGYGGAILMKIYGGVANILNPNQTWPSNCDLPVIKFPPKSEIKIRVGIPKHLW